MAKLVSSASMIRILKQTLHSNIEVYGLFVYIKIELCGSHRIAVYGNLTSAKSLFFSQLRIWLREGEVRINITLPVCLKLFDQSDFTTTRHDFSHFSNVNKSFLVTSKFSFLHQKPWRVISWPVLGLNQMQNFNLSLFMDH